MIAKKINSHTPTQLHLVVTLLVALFALLNSTGGLQAHRFEVAIVQSPDFDKQSAQQFIDGFMLATTQRDAHANEESDGHLGGLDVYVTLFEATPIAEIASFGIDIIVLNSATQIQGMVGAVPENTNSVPVILPSGISPIEQTPNAPGVVSFLSAFEQAYNSPASRFAAAGYNAARRIDVAVRAQGGVADQIALETSFIATTTAFNWQ